MRRQYLGVAAGLCAALAACREIPAPEGGVRALSRVVLGSPGIVVGDTLRDSLGNVAPLRIVAFDENGDTIASLPAVTFLVFDTTAALDGDILVGEHTGRARVVAQVAGLQSRIDTVIVTLRPDTIVGADSTRQVRRFVPGSDTIYATAPLNVAVRHRDGTSVSGVDAVVVTYQITRTLANGAGGVGPTVVFAEAAGAVARDTTAGGGLATRTLRLRRLSIPQLANDSAMVTATAAYRGQSLGTVTFTIVFQTQ
jgi:hypothetical protein